MDTSAASGATSPHPPHTPGATGGIVSPSSSPTLERVRVSDKMCFRLMNKYVCGFHIGKSIILETQDHTVWSTTSTHSGPVYDCIQKNNIYCALLPVADDDGYCDVVPIDLTLPVSAKADGILPTPPRFDRRASGILPSPNLKRGSLSSGVRWADMMDEEDTNLSCAEVSAKVDANQLRKLDAMGNVMSTADAIVNALSVSAAICDKVQAQGEDAEFTTAEMFDKITGYALDFASHLPSTRNEKKVSPKLNLANIDENFSAPKSKEDVLKDTDDFYPLLELVLDRYGYLYLLYLARFHDHKSPYWLKIRREANLAFQERHKAGLFEKDTENAAALLLKIVPANVPRFQTFRTQLMGKQHPFVVSEALKNLYHSTDLVGPKAIEKHETALRNFLSSKLNPECKLARFFSKLRTLVNNLSPCSCRRGF